MDILWLTLKSIGMSLAVALPAMALIVIGMILWIRKMVKHRAYAFFWQPNRQMTGKLVKPENNTFLVGSGSDAEKYVIEPSKAFWTFYPPGFPSFIQEPVPSFTYIKNNAEPVDPYNQDVLVTSKTMRIVSDEAMLKQTWKDVRESVGLRPLGSKSSWLVYAILGVLMLGVITTGYLSYVSFNKLSEMNLQMDHLIEIMGG